MKNLKSRDIKPCLHCATQDMQMSTHRIIFKIVNSSYNAQRLLIILSPDVDSELDLNHRTDTIYVYNSTTKKFTCNDNCYPFAPIAILTMLCDNCLITNVIGC